MKILLNQLTKDSDLKEGLQVCYQDANGVFNQIGVISNVSFDGINLYTVNGASYAANELKLIAPNIYTISEIQQAIFEQTGLKTSVKKMKGGMKHHIKIWAIFQNGEYPKFPFEWVNEFKKQFKPDLIRDCPVFGSPMELNIPCINFSDFEPIVYKKESKPKPIEQMKVKQWGSKNSQMRLNKASARAAKIPLWQKQ